MVAFDPIPVPRLTGRAMKRESLCQGECKHLQKEELVSLPCPEMSEGSGQRLCFGKVFKVIKLLSHIPR